MAFEISSTKDDTSTKPKQKNDDKIYTSKQYCGSQSMSNISAANQQNSQPKGNLYKNSKEQTKNNNSNSPQYTTKTSRGFSHCNNQKEQNRPRVPNQGDVRTQFRGRGRGCNNRGSYGNSCNRYPPPVRTQGNFNQPPPSFNSTGTVGGYNNHNHANFNRPPNFPPSYEQSLNPNFVGRGYGFGGPSGPRPPPFPMPYGQQCVPRPSTPMMPPYEEKFSQRSNSQEKGAGEKHHQNRSREKQFDMKTSVKIQARDLVSALIKFEGFWTTVDILRIDINYSFKDAIDVIKANGHIFETSIDKTTGKANVVLKPSIKLCNQNTTQKGCLKPTCSFLHMCKQQLEGSCTGDLKTCIYGHNIKSDHNNAVLKKYCLESLRNDLIFSILKNSICSTNTLQLCSSYQNGYQTCSKGDQCPNLHLCKSFVTNMGTCSDSDNCILDHDLFDTNVKKILVKHDISTNDNPRDILKNIIKKITPSSSTVDDKAEKKFSKVRNDSKMLMAWHLIGEVENPYICLKWFQEGGCKSSEQNCKSLHSKYIFYWQFYHKTCSKWYNFHEFHSKILEKNYQDPNVSELVIPKLDKSKCSGALVALPSILGVNELTVNFDTMTMKRGINDTDTIQIRQLTTPSSVVVSNDPNTSNFTWYFYSSDNIWEKYDSQKSSLSSENLDRAFIACQNTMKFTAGRFNYEIDFHKMTQKNMTTSKIRNIRRRTSPNPTFDFGKQVKVGAGSVIQQLPKHWIKMPADAIFHKEKLTSGIEEYINIKQLATQTSYCEILSIERIQNADLWKQFQNKENELKGKCGGFVNKQKLFHVVKDEDLEYICTYNLDYRIHDVDADFKYGIGTYFYNSFQTAWSKNGGRNKMLLADVIIGQITNGDSSMTRPPENPKTNHLFDSTVDDVSDPNLFVKYNRQEYYPSYIITFR